MKIETRWLPWLWLAMIALVVMATLNEVAQGLIPITTADLLLSKFRLDAEANFPTWFSSMLLLLAGLGWWSKAQRVQGRDCPDRWRFFLLAGFFVYLSIDESAGVHELATWPVEKHLGRSGLLYHAWWVAAIIPLAVVAALMLPMLRRLSTSLRRGFVGGALVYLGGALLVEMIGGAIAEQTGKQTFVYFLVSSLEETMEMMGVMLLLRGMAKDAVGVQHAADDEIQMVHLSRDFLTSRARLSATPATVA